MSEEFRAKRKEEERRQEELALQKKQLFAQRVDAAAAVVSAVATSQTAAEVERMRREAGAAADATARHQFLIEIQQREMAERQEQMGAEQRVTNFRQAILTALPLLKEEEKAKYVIEQLLPGIETKCEKVESCFHFRVIVKIFKFLDYSQIFFANDPDFQKFIVEDENPKRKLNEAIARHQKANGELEKIKSSTASDQFAAIIVAGIAGFIIFFAAFYFLKSQVPHDSNKSVDPEAVDYICYPVSSLLGSMAFVLSFKTAKKETATNRLKEVANLSTKLAVLKAEMDQNTEAFESWSKQQPETWGKIKTNLVDSYLASEWGQKFIQLNMFNLFMLRRMDMVAKEQIFLPPSARPLEEQWQSAFKPKIQPEVELATQRQLKIRDILLSRLTPNYDTQECEIADLDVKFIELDLERPDVISGKSMTDKDVNEMVAALTEQIQTIESSGFPNNEVMSLVKNIANDKLEYLRSTIATNSSAFPSGIDGIDGKYKNQLDYLQSKNDEQLMLLKTRRPEKFS